MCATPSSLPSLRKFSASAPSESMMRSAALAITSSESESSPRDGRAMGYSVTYEVSARKEPTRPDGGIRVRGFRAPGSQLRARCEDRAPGNEWSKVNIGSGAAGVNSFTGPPPVGPADVKAAAGRIATRVRPVSLVAADAKPFDESSLYLACETTQVTGSFEARGAANLALYHLEHGALPEAGTVTAVSGNGNAALACAWAARETGVRATVFIAEETDFQTSDASAAHRADRVRLTRRLIEFGAELHSVAGGAQRAALAAEDYAEQIGALYSHSSDNPHIAVGAGTLAAEINELIGAEIDTIIVPVGSGLVAGTCAALEHTGIRVVPVEPQHGRTLSAALEAGFPIDAPGADSAMPAADSP